MITYKEKIAHLISLLEQIKTYSLKELEKYIEIEKAEELLSMPEVSDRAWEDETFNSQRIFTDFLNIHISVYSKVLKKLEQEKAGH